MTQNPSSNTQVTLESTVEEPEFEVKVEGDAPVKQEEPLKQEEDVEALRKQLSDLKSAQEVQRSQAIEADRRAQQAANQLAELWKSANQSQLDSIETALGAAQIEIDSAKKDIVLAGSAQDYAALADAQERLAAAKAHAVALEQGKTSYANQQPPKQQLDPIENTPGLSYDEKSWLRQHPEAMTDPRKNAKLNAAYFDAMDKGLSRGSREYFEFIEEQMGYRDKPVQQPQQPSQEESSILYSAPPSKNVPNAGTGGSKKVFTLTKEEAEIAKLSGVSPQEYVKQRELLREQKRIHPGDFPER